MSIQYTEADLAAARVLDSFLPDRIFDAHMHISLFATKEGAPLGIGDYKRDVAPIFGKREVRGMALPKPTRELADRAACERTLDFIDSELDAHPEFLGGVLVKPEEGTEAILADIRHPRIRAVKCYHLYARRERTDEAGVFEYLPEAALEIADQRSMAVILHLVKDEALADPENLAAVKEIARRYPSAKLVLAHSARAFAAWTVMDAVEELIPFSNIFFDFSAICESPSMIRILKAVGASRCMWGSDYNVCTLLGKAISLGEGFYWIQEADLARWEGASRIRPRHILLENLMATREAALLSGLSTREVEDLFYGNACRILA